jgi:hypothetical protein
VSYVIAWIVKTVARWFCGGDTAKATGIVGWVGFAVAVLGAAFLSGYTVRTYYRAEIAEIRAAASAAEAAQNRRVLLRERAERDAITARDNAYAQIAIAREQAVEDSARLSGQLTAALDRLRRVAATGRGGMPATAPGVDQCADLRAALGRAVGALDLLQAAGDQVARDGQYGVDVATDAARAAASMTPEAAR